MKNIYFTLALLGLFCQASAQWQQLGGPTAIGAIRGIVSDGNTLWANSEYNRVFRSTNGGLSWQLTTNGLPSQVTVFSSSQIVKINNTLLVEYNNQVYRSTNGGDNWVLSNNGISPGDLLNLYVVNNTVVLFSVSGVYRSNDEGQTWQSASTGLASGNIYVYDAYVESGVLYACLAIGANNYVYKTTNNAVSWIDITGNLGYFYYASITVMNSNLFLITEYGELYSTPINGSNWSLVSTFYGDFVKGIINHNNQLYLSTTTGIYTTTNLGSTWNVVSMFSVYEGGLFKSLDGYIYTNIDLNMTGGESSLQRSANNGLTWELLINEINSESIREISAEGNHIIILTENNLVYFSNDYGISWNYRVASEANDVKCVKDASNNTHFFIAQFTNLWHSTDNGMNWNLTSNGIPNSYLLHDIHVNTNSAQPVLYISATTSSNSNLYRSLDLGTTWTPCNISLNSFAYNISMTFKDESTAFLSTNSQVFKTTDGGLNWSLIYTDNEITDIEWHPQANRLLASKLSYELLISDDEGLTWQSYLTPYFDIHGLISNGNSLLMITDGALNVSMDQGDSWSFFSSLFSLYNVAIVTPEFIYAGIYYGLGYMPNYVMSGVNISGNIQFDIDGNCSTELGNTYLQNTKIKILQNASVQQQYLISSSGFYNFSVPVGDYTVQVDTTGMPFNVICPVNNSYNASINATTPIINDLNFKLICKPGFDLASWSVNRVFGWIFPGQESHIRVSAGLFDQLFMYNVVCANVSGGQVKVRFNGPVSYAGPAPGALTPLVSNDTLIYNIADFTQINPYSSFIFKLITDTTATVGEFVCFQVWITPIQGDNNPVNNYLQHCLPVTNSYDPNIKEVSPPVVNNPGDWVTYTIHFQNTGNAPAINIKVRDTLSMLLDWETLQVLDYSHPVSTQISGNGVVTFSFANIMLADSLSDPEGSKGYVQFRIRTRPEFVPPMTLGNKAAIYFDFNAPVITNEAVISYPTSTNGIVKAENVMLYPNPASDEVTLFTPYVNSLVVLSDLQGKVIMSLNVTERQTKLNTAVLSPGVYLIQVQHHQSTQQGKLIIVR